MVLLLFMLPVPVYAAAGAVDTTGADDITAENSVADGMDAAKDSVVQVVVEYVTPDGTSYILKSGSGFLISPQMVLTDYDMMSLSEEEKSTAEVYLSGILGTPVSFAEMEGVQTIQYQIGVVMYRDVIIAAEVNSYSSREIGLGILNLTTPVNRSTAQLGDGSSVTAGTKVYVLGYKNVAVMDTEKKTEQLSQRDLKLTEGTVSGTSPEASFYFCHDAKIKHGASGGPTVDENGIVVGMNLAGREEDGKYHSLNVDEIRALLDSCQIAYQQANPVSVSESEIAEARGGETETADTSILDAYIVSYGMLEKGDYTEESYAALVDALTNAKIVRGDPAATQEEVDRAVESLDMAKEGLIQAKKMNWPFIITVIILVLVIVTGLIVYLWKFRTKKAPEPLETLEQTSSGYQRPEPKIEMPKPKNSGKLKRTDTADDHYNETTVLGMDRTNEDGTVVLGVSGGAVDNGYLVRVSTGERVDITGYDFVIGKDRSRVNYCIGDNPSVSRCHAKITRKGSSYYVTDLKSTNYTCLNGKILMQDEETKLTDGDILRFSNEEFEFHE